MQNVILNWRVVIFSEKPKKSVESLFLGGTFQLFQVLNLVKRDFSSVIDLCKTKCNLV